MQNQVGPIKQALALTPRSPASMGAVAGDRHYQNHLNPREADNHLQAALNEYARALEQAPDSPELVGKMAKVFLRLGQDVKARQSARKMLALLEQKNMRRVGAGRLKAEAYLILGLLDFNEGASDKALPSLRQAMSLAPLQSSAARLCLHKLYKSRILKNLWKPSVGLDFVLAGYYLVTALLLAPFSEERLSFGNLVLLFPQLAHAWMEEEMGFGDKALQRYLDIHRQFPGLPSVTLIIGELFREKGKLDEARYWFQLAIERHPDSLNAYLHLARIQEEREEYAEMAVTYERLLRFSPQNADIQCNLANAYYYCGRYQEAITHYGIALQLGTENTWRAMVAQSMGNIQSDYLQNSQAAIAYYEMASLLNPEDVENYIQLGMLYFQKDDLVNAEMIYRKALAFAPEHPKLHSNLGYLRWMANDVEQAIAFYEKAITLDNGYEIPINNLGVIYLDMLGQVDRAIDLFEQALEIDDQYALAYYNLGRAYSFMGNRLEAAHCFHTAQELNRHSKDLDHDELTARINHLFDTCELELLD